MEGFIALAAAVLFWRTALSTGVALIVAILLAKYVSWFTGGLGLAVVLVAFGAGLLWESSARSQGAKPTPATVKLSTPVATLALAFFGAVAGSWAGAAAGSLAAGALVLVIAAATVAIYTSHVGKRPFAWGSFAHSAVSTLSGLGCVALLVVPRA